MPYHVAKSTKCGASKPWAVIKDSDGKIMGCHPTKEKANKQLAALYANEPGLKTHSLEYWLAWYQALVTEVDRATKLSDSL